jgi:hypothetical protein
MGTSDARERQARRWTGRIGLGAAIGAGVGLIAGLIWGAIVYRAGSLGMWLVVLGCVLFLGILGGFVGGLSGLESTDPGREPSQREEPLADPDEFVGPERGRASPEQGGATPRPR